MKTWLGIFLCTSIVVAQDETDAIRPFYSEFGPGARALALSGAYTALAEDFTATYWNPAGLAQIQKTEIYGALSLNNLKNDVSYEGTLSKNDRGFTLLNSFGAVFPVPTYRGSLVFALGYNRVNPFNDYNKVVGSPEVFGSRFRQIEETNIDGGLNHWSFSGAVDISKNTSIGGTLNLVVGRQRAAVDYLEDDTQEDILADIRQRQVSFEINPDYTGVNFKFGTLFRPVKDLRLALTVTTPTYLNVEENSSFYEFLEDDDQETFDFYEPSFLKYKITSPWRFEFGGAYKINLLTLSASMEYVDWSETRFSSNILDNGRDIDAEINNNLITRYRATHDTRLGAEMIVPQLGCKLMAGYAYKFSPYRNGVEAVNSNRQYLSGGISFLVDKQVKIDAAYQRGWWKQSTTDDLLGTDENGVYFTTREKLQSNRLLISLSYRF